jgi:hypothetical protein
MVVVESGCGVGRDITVQPFCQEVAKKLAVIAKLDIGSTGLWKRLLLDILEGCVLG